MHISLKCQNTYKLIDYSVNVDVFEIFSDFGFIEYLI